MYNKEKVTTMTPTSEIVSPWKLQYGNMYGSLTKSPTFAQNCIYYFAEYSENTTIHGLKYVAEHRRSLFERICWISVIVTSLSISIALVLNVYLKWVNSPVIVSFATTEVPIFEIPFPAVTICPEVKSDAHLFNYTDVYLKIKRNGTVTANEAKHFQYMSLVCNTPKSLLDQTMMTIDEKAIDYLLKASPHVRDYVYDVEWAGVHFYENSSSLFTPILTDEGICYTFNMLDGMDLFTDITKYPEGCYSSNGEQSKWSLEKGYAADADLDSYPRRTMTAGVDGGLKIILRFFKEHIDFACGNSVQGFKVVLHQPSQLPRIKQSHFRVPFDHSVVATIIPKIMVTSSDLRNYAVKDKKCYFDSEKILKFFKAYDQENCLKECLTNFTLKLCECVNFHMPREESTPICGTAKQQCVHNARVIFLLNEAPPHIKGAQILKLKWKYQNSEAVNDINNKCECLPACHSINFDIETSQTSGRWEETVSIAYEAGDVDENIINDIREKRIFLTELNLFFKNMQFATTSRNALYKNTDFWANVGGIIGLFTGFSFISLFEILYYLTLRIYCNVKMYGFRYWSGDPNLLDGGRLTPRK